MAGGGYGTADSSRDSMSAPENPTPDTNDIDNHNEEMLRNLVLRRQQKKKRRLTYTEEAPGTPTAKCKQRPVPTKYNTPTKIIQG